MNRPFKFRHVNEIVGTFTVLAVAMLVAGIYFAGRAQGWFEGSFRINVVFDTPEGAFGLQEGAEVQVQNTPAGRVGKIYPNADGFMQTTVSIKNRFHPFITEDSVAKVKLRFAIAGDAFVDISPGTGPTIEEDGFITGVKDEEILDIISNAIGEMESIALPMLAEVQQMLQHVNTILAGITESQGTAGAMVFDPEAKANILATLGHTEQIAREAGSMMTNAVPALMARAERMTDTAESMLTNDVRRVMADLEAIQTEAALTLRESRRLIEGLQRHWLLRRYVPFDETSRLAIDSRGAAAVDGKALVETRTRLGEARRAVDHAAVGEAAYELGVLELLRGDTARALDLLAESKLALLQTGTAPVAALLLEARIMLDQGAHGAVESVLDAIEALPRGDRTEADTAQIELLRGRSRLAQDDLPGVQAALDAARRPVRRADLPILSAAREDLQAALLERRGDWRGAAEVRQRQADQLRAAGRFHDLAYALERKGHARRANGEVEEAGLAWLSAAASYLEQEAMTDAARCLAFARDAADASDNPLLRAGVDRFAARPAMRLTKSNERGAHVDDR